MTYFVKIVKSTLLATNSNYLLSRRTRKKGFMKFVGNTVLKCKIMYKYTKKMMVQPLENNNRWFVSCWPQTVTGSRPHAFYQHKLTPPNTKQFTTGILITLSYRFFPFSPGFFKDCSTFSDFRWPSLRITLISYKCSYFHIFDYNFNCFKWIERDWNVQRFGCIHNFFCGGIRGRYGVKKIRKEWVDNPASGDQRRILLIYGKNYNSPDQIKDRWRRTCFKKRDEWNRWKRTKTQHRSRRIHKALIKDYGSIAMAEWAAEGTAALVERTPTGASAEPSGMAPIDVSKVFEVGEEAVLIEAGEPEVRRITWFGEAGRRETEFVVAAPEDSTGEDVEVARPHQTVAGYFQFLHRVRRSVVTGRLLHPAERGRSRARGGSSVRCGRSSFGGGGWRPASNCLTLRSKWCESGSLVSSERSTVGPEAGSHQPLLGYIRIGDDVCYIRRNAAVAAAAATQSIRFQVSFVASCFQLGY